MGKSASEAAPDRVAEAARQRLELLRQELQRGAPARTSPSPAPEQPTEKSPGIPEAPEAPEAPERKLPGPGRHTRHTVTARFRVSAWLAERLPATLRGRVRLGGREWASLALFLALGLAIAGCMALRSGGNSGDVVPMVSAPKTPPGVTASGEPAALVSPAAGPSSGTRATSTVVVDVAGKVRRPGVFTLPAGSRVIDALRKAGGARPRTDLTGLNLARVLTDGEQVLVGQSAAPGIAAGAVGAPGAPASGALVSLNTATLEQLDGLPGVGPVTAQKIMSWRQAHGAFSSVDELLEVDGIGEKTLADLAPMVTL